MSDSSVIKEFLVSVGIITDAAGIKRFEQGLAAVTKGVVAFAAGVEAMAVAVEAAVAKVSSKFEDLYYASQRIGDSVENIRGYTFAIGQMGGSAQGAMSALESMGEFFRSNPGGERFIQGLGVATRDANGQMRDMTGIMDDLGAKFRAMPYYAAKVRAQMLGIDPRTLQAMLRGTDEAQDRYHQLAQSMGVDQQAAAKASHEFMNDLRELMALVTLAMDKVVLAIQPTARRVVQWLEDLHQATDGWSTGIIALTAVLGPLIFWLGPAIVGMLALGAAIVAIAMSSFADDTGDATSGLAGLKGALGDCAVAARKFADAFPPEFWDFMLKAVRSIGAVLVDIATNTLHLLTGSLTVAADVVHEIIDLLHGDWKAAWRDAAKTASDSIAVIKQSWHDGKHVVGDIWNPRSFTNPGKPGAAANQNAPSARSPVHGMIGDLAEQMTGYFRRSGFSAEAASGITAGAFAESKLNPNAVNPTSGAYGIGQWLGPRKAELFRRYGQHPNLDQQLQFMMWELTHREGAAGAAIQGQSSALGAMQAYVTRFMRPGAGTGGDLARGAAFLNGQLGQQLAANGASVSMSQKTDINIHGVGDPMAAGREAANQQGRVNSAMVRQLKTAAS